MMRSQKEAVVLSLQELAQQVVTFVDSMPGELESIEAADDSPAQ
jgi:hypothetical protein